MDDFGVITVSCGACRDNELCERSRVGTMKANGFPIEWADELKGLKTSGSYSQVYWKLKELIKKHSNG